MMERFPSEILSQIFESLSPNDILNLPFERTMQGLTRAQAELRFSTIRAHLSRSSLNRLKRISSHPLINQCVSKITIGLQMLNCIPQADNSDRMWYNPSEYMFSGDQDLLRDLSPLESLQNQNGLSMAEALKSSQKAYLEQQRLQHSGLDLAMLAHAFGGLTALKTIKIDIRLIPINEDRSSRSLFSYGAEMDGAVIHKTHLDNSNGHIVPLLAKSLAA